MLSYTPRPLADARILIIEAAESDPHALVNLLFQQGYANVSLARSTEALQKTAAFKPDLVVLDDGCTPGGFAYLEALRKNQAHAGLPILLHIAPDAMESRRLAGALGASDFLPKPVAAEELALRCKIHLEKHYLQQTLNAQRHQRARELSAAGEIQRRLFPTADTLADIARAYRIQLNMHYICPHLSGTCLLGIVPLSPARLAFYLLRAGGTQLEAAMHLFQFHLLMQKHMTQGGTPAEYLSTISQALLAEEGPPRGNDILLAVADRDARALHYASTGESFTLALSQREKNAPLRVLEAEHHPSLGAEPGYAYTHQTVAFENGQILVFGCTELMQALRALPPEAHGAASEELLKSLIRHAPPGKEVTMLLCSNL